jgi:hypothetical protein
VALLGKISGEIGGDGALSDAALWIGNDDHWHAEPPLVVILIAISSRLRRPPDAYFLRKNSMANLPSSALESIRATDFYRQRPGPVP